MHVDHRSRFDSRDRCRTASSGSADSASADPISPARPATKATASAGSISDLRHQTKSSSVDASEGLSKLGSVRIIVTEDEGSEGGSEAGSDNGNDHSDGDGTINGPSVGLGGVDKTGEGWSDPAAREAAAALMEAREVSEQSPRRHLPPYETGQPFPRLSGDCLQPSSRLKEELLR